MPPGGNSMAGGKGLASIVTLCLFATALVSGCGNQPNVPNDLVGKQLDTAESELDAQGITYTETDASNSTFGIIEKSNWTVCQTKPAAGQSVSGDVELIAKHHSCTDSTPIPIPSDTALPLSTAASAPTAPPPAPVAPADACHHGGITYCVLNLAVTQATIGSTICVSGWTSTVRPSESYTENLKRQQIASEGLPGGLSNYEDDHRMPLELGGSRVNPYNLSPESPASPNPKDSGETSLKYQVCDRQLTSAQAQQQMVANWLAAYPGYKM